MLIPLCDEVHYHEDFSHTWKEAEDALFLVETVLETVKLFYDVTDEDGGYSHGTFFDLRLLLAVGRSSFSNIIQNILILLREIYPRCELELCDHLVYVELFNFEQLRVNLDYLRWVLCEGYGHDVIWPIVAPEIFVISRLSSLVFDELVPSVAFTPVPIFTVFSFLLFFLFAVSFLSTSIRLDSLNFHDRLL